MLQAARFHNRCAEHGCRCVPKAVDGHDAGHRVDAQGNVALCVAVAAGQPDHGVLAARRFSQGAEFNVANRRGAATGLTRPYEWAVALSSAWWAGLAVWLLFIRIRERFGTWTAGVSTVGLLFATPLSFYGWMHGSMSHAVSFFVATMALLSLENALRGRSMLWAAATGLWAGLGSRR